MRARIRAVEELNDELGAENETLKVEVRDLQQENEEMHDRFAYVFCADRILKLQPFVFSEEEIDEFRELQVSE